MADYAKSNEEIWLDALTEIVAALLAGGCDHIYGAHARNILPALDILLLKATDDGKTKLAQSLTESRERLKNMIPPG